MLIFYMVHGVNNARALLNAIISFNKKFYEYLDEAVCECKRVNTHSKKEDSPNIINAHHL